MKTNLIIGLGTMLAAAAVIGLLITAYIWLGLYVKFFYPIHFTILVRCHSRTLFKLLAHMTLGGKSQISGYLAAGIPGIDQKIFYQVHFFSEDKIRQGDFFTLVKQL